MMCIDGQGRKVSSSSPERQVWYSATCSYWTDNWETLAATRTGIPCCPRCGSPGMMNLYVKWEAGATEYDRANPGYKQFILNNKEKCLHPNTGGMIAAWKMQSNMLAVLKETSDAEGGGDTEGSPRSVTTLGAEQGIEGSPREESGSDP